MFSARVEVVRSRIEIDDEGVALTVYSLGLVLQKEADLEEPSCGTRSLVSPVGGRRQRDAEIQAFVKPEKDSICQVVKLEARVEVEISVGALVNLLLSCQQALTEHDIPQALLTEADIGHGLGNELCL